MTLNATLKAQKREDAGKGVARKLRAAGRVPAVIYGQGEAATHLTLDAAEARYLFERISVENTIVSLEVEGDKAPVSTLIREIQVHPFRPDLLHVDFYKVQKGVTIEVQIPVHLEGTPVGVQSEGGTIQQILHEIPVRVIPSKIPDSITIDVSALAVGDSLHISDIQLPEGSEAAIDDTRTICTVVLPRGAVSAAGEEGEAEEAAEGEAAAEAPAAEAADGAEGSADEGAES